MQRGLLRGRGGSWRGRGTMGIPVEGGTHSWGLGQGSGAEPCTPIHALEHRGTCPGHPSGEGWHGALNPGLGSPDPHPELLGLHTVGRLE